MVQILINNGYIIFIALSMYCSYFAASKRQMYYDEMEINCEKEEKDKKIKLVEMSSTIACVIYIIMIMTMFILSLSKSLSPFLNSDTYYFINSATLYYLQIIITGVFGIISFSCSLIGVINIISTKDEEKNTCLNISFSFFMFSIGNASCAIIIICK